MRGNCIDRYASKQHARSSNVSTYLSSGWKFTANRIASCIPSINLGLDTGKKDSPALQFDNFTVQSVGLSSDNLPLFLDNLLVYM